MVHLVKYFINFRGKEVGYAENRTRLFVIEAPQTDEETHSAN